MGYNNTFDLVSKDIEELQKLVKKLQNSSSIPKIEMDLALSKMQNIYELLLMIQNNEVERLADQVTSSPRESEEEIPRQENHGSDIDKAPEEPVEKKHEEEKEPDLDFISEKKNEKKDIQDGVKEDKSKEKTVSENNPETAPAQKDNGKRNEKILAEKYEKNSAYLNEKVGQNKTSPDITSRIKATPISSIAGSIGLNDKFFFIRELFNGNAETFRNTMAVLDEASNFNEAYNYLLNNFEWDMDSEIVQDLLTLVRRKFISPGNE